MYNVSHLDINDRTANDVGLNLTNEQIFERMRRLNIRWQELCRRFLPLTGEDSFWCYSRPANPDDPPQGWKLHISATILTAVEVLEKVAPILISGNVLFKSPRSLQQIMRLNSGISHGYSQIGKFITIYPRNDSEAISLAEQLHKLTAGVSAPPVPFDLRYRSDSCIYYRYGAFREQKIKDARGNLVPAIRDLSGKLVPDIREEPKPVWMESPFPLPERSFAEDAETPLNTTYRVLRALRQRGKGGVYQALDFGTNPPRYCIVKEGRRNGETGWDDWDGYRLVKYEAAVLRELETTGINVPLVYETFELEQNYYLITEFMDGKSLDELLRTRRRRLSVRQSVKFAIQITEILTKIHREGWVWGDCKPGNLFLTGDSQLRPLDFESTCRQNHSRNTGWRTIEFSAPQDEDSALTPMIYAEDIYSLGTVIYFLLTGRTYRSDSPHPIRKLRRDVPEALINMIEETLILPLRKKRPSIGSIKQRLHKIARSLDLYKR